MIIREAQPSDLKDVLSVERAAFNANEEAELVMDLLGDDSAKPLLSLLAYDQGQAVGHILFTKAQLDSAPEVSVYLLAPLAVVPDWQRKGVGSALIKRGLSLLSAVKVDLVFVLGHPEYYPRSGFTPAGKLGFEAPYPIPDEVADAWMVKYLKHNESTRYTGKVICAKALQKPEYWRE